VSVKTSAPVLGFNHNLKFGPRIYHVQTEDSGLPHAHYITHLFVGGNILASMKSSYATRADDVDLARLVRSLMETQHKAMVRRLVGGEFAGKVEQIAPHYEPGVLATGQTGPAAVNVGKPAPPAPAPARVAPPMRVVPAPAPRPAPQTVRPPAPAPRVPAVAPPAVPRPAAPAARPQAQPVLPRPGPTAAPPPARPQAPAPVRSPAPAKPLPPSPSPRAPAPPRGSRRRRRSRPRRARASSRCCPLPRALPLRPRSRRIPLPPSWPTWSPTPRWSRPWRACPPSSPRS
jgi:hypothetical protein